MNNHDGEEDGKEVWDGRRVAADETPSNHSDSIDSVVNLASIAVPSRGEEGAAVLAADEGGVVDSLPWELGEGFAEDESSLLHLAEAILLAVAGVEDVVAAEEGDEECPEDGPGVGVESWIGLGNEERAVAVG